jgi:hypothetical protein
MQAVPIAHPVSQKVHEVLWYDLFLPGKNMSTLLFLSFFIDCFGNCVGDEGIVYIWTEWFWNKIPL